VGLKHTTLVVIGIDCTSSWKSNYHTIANKTTPKSYICKIHCTCIWRIIIEGNFDSRINVLVIIYIIYSDCVLFLIPFYSSELYCSTFVLCLKCRNTQTLKGFIHSRYVPGVKDYTDEKNNSNRFIFSGGVAFEYLVRIYYLHKQKTFQQLPLWVITIAL
jgi:hypothetical protein